MVIYTIFAYLPDDATVAHKGHVSAQEFYYHKFFHFKRQCILNAQVFLSNAQVFISNTQVFILNAQVFYFKRPGFYFKRPGFYFKRPGFLF